MPQLTKCVATGNSQKNACLGTQRLCTHSKPGPRVSRGRHGTPQTCNCFRPPVLGPKKGGVSGAGGIAHLCSHRLCYVTASAR